MVVLGARRIIIQLIMTLTNIILARLLLPETFGVYAIISFLILTFGLVANFGMGPSLVQIKTQITKEQLRAIFTLLMIASLIFMGLIFFLAPVISIWYQGQLGETGVWWLRIFSLSVVLDHMATISIHLLQRNLEFKKFTVGEIFIALLSKVLTIYLVFTGWGLGGLVMGNLIGKTLAVAVYYLLYPWPVGLNFSRCDIQPFLPFGLNFQANNLASSLNSAVVPIVVGTLSGPSAVGLINWAGGVRSAGFAPFDVIEKLIFPSVARAQENRHLLKTMIEKMLKHSCLLSFPLIVLIGALAPAFIRFVYTDKWLPGLTTLYLSLLQGIFILLGTITTDVLFALGKSATVRNISLFWALLQWLLTVPLVLLLGFNGVVVAGIFVSATFFIPLFKARQIVPFSVWPNVAPYLIYSLLSGGIVYGLTKFVPVDSIWRLLFMGFIGGFIYLIFLICFEKQTLQNDFAKLKDIIIPSL